MPCMLLPPWWASALLDKVRLYTKYLQTGGSVKPGAQGPGKLFQKQHEVTIGLAALSRPCTGAEAGRNENVNQAKAGGRVSSLGSVPSKPSPWVRREHGVFPPQGDGGCGWSRGQGRQAYHCWLWGLVGLPTPGKES